MVASLHDIPGTRRAWVSIGSYTAATDDGVADPLFAAPYKCVLVGINAYFQGAVVSDGTNYFSLITKYGGTAIGTAYSGTAAGTIAYRTALAVYSGSQSLDADDLVDVTYGTVGSGTVMPQALLELQYISG
jgi:hypothetical protein